MSGHSKWSTIKRKKEKTDQQRAKVFTKVGRELAMAAKSGGADPNTNSKLKDAIARAKAANVPNDNIDRIIKKAAGEQGGSVWEEIVYEGYGPGGVPVIVETLTDNRNRTAADMRHFFDKCGGNLGQPGSVMFLFRRKGIIAIEGEGLTEDKVMEDALDAGADDFTYDGDVFEISTDPDSVAEVAEALEGKGYSLLSAEAEYVPLTETEVADEETRLKMDKLLDMLDDDDDVQNVWHGMSEVGE